MPYGSIDDLPKSVKARYDERCQEVYRRVFNQVFKRDAAESRAGAEANFAANNCKRST